MQVRGWVNHVAAVSLVNRDGRARDAYLKGALERATAG